MSNTGVPREFQLRYDSSSNLIVLESREGKGRWIPGKTAVLKMRQSLIDEALHLRRKGYEVHIEREVYHAGEANESV